MLTAEQHQLRKSGVGASEVAAVLGLDSYTSPLDVWARKTGRAPVWDEAPQRLDQKLGHMLEPVMATLYQDERPGVVLEERGTIVGPEPWMLATPDRWASVGDFPVGEEPTIYDQWLVQFKTKNWRTFEGFGAEGTDEIPDTIQCQVQWEMAVAGRDRCDVGVLVDGREWYVFPVAYDPELGADLMSRIGDWWKRYVVTDIEPPVGTHAQDVEYLKRKFAAPTKDLLPATPAIEEACERLAIAQQTAKDAEFEKDSAKSVLMQLIGEHKGTHARAGKVSWNAMKGRAITDWEKIARAGIAAADLDRLVIEHTSLTAGGRQFRFTPAKG